MQIGKPIPEELPLLCLDSSALVKVSHTSSENVILLQLLQTLKTKLCLSFFRETETFLCTMSNEFRSLNSIDRLKALNFYNSKLKNSTKENAVKKMLEYIHISIYTISEILHTVKSTKYQ